MSDHHEAAGASGHPGPPRLPDWMPRDMREPGPAADGPAAAAGLDLDRLVYARGFILSSEGEPHRPDHWVRRAVGGWILWHDPRLLVAEAGRAPGLSWRRTSLLCLGTIIDAEAPEGGPRAALDRLARALRRSEGAFLAALDTMAGRHALIYGVGGRTHIVGDAAGTRQVFRYRREATHVSSHGPLIARNGAEAGGIKLVHRSGYPGFDTPWRHVHILTPNTRLRLEDGTLRRFWPRRRLRPVSVSAAAGEVGRLMEGALRGLAADHALAISVTAGLDSRLTLALSRGLEGRLFTFYRGDDMADDRLDLEFAEACTRDLGRPVEVMRLRERGSSMPKAFERLLDGNTMRPHIRKLTWMLHSRFPRDEPWIHVRSNVSEVGRQFYKDVDLPDPPRALDLARIFLTRRSEATKPREVFDTIHRFEQYAEATGILRGHQGVDLTSLFYWEHRLASWFANCLTESDAGMDTVAPYNCRRLLEVMLSVPRVNRERASIHRRIIADRAPELTRHPVNGRAVWT